MAQTSQSTAEPSSSVIAMGRGAVVISRIVDAAWVLLILISIIDYGKEGHPSMFFMALMLVGPVSAALALLGLILGIASLCASSPLTGPQRQAVIRSGKLSLIFLVAVVLSVALTVYLPQWLR